MIHQQSPSNDIERRGEDIYALHIRPQLAASDEGKFVVIDVTTGAYQVDIDHLQALESMLARHEASSLYSIRVGYPAAYKLGGHMISEVP